MSLLTQSGIDDHNRLLGGIAKEDGEKLPGMNEQINLHRQQEDIKAKDLPNLTRLYKQILSDRETDSFVPEPFADDQELLTALQEFAKSALAKDGLVHKLASSMQALKDADPGGVYVKSSALSGISQAIFQEYDFISRALGQYAETDVAPVPAGDGPTKSIKEQREKYLKQSVFSLAELDSALSKYIAWRKQDDPNEKSSPELDEHQPLLCYLCAEVEKRSDSEGLSAAISEFEALCSPGSIDTDRRAPGPDDENDPGGVGYRQIQAIRNMLEKFKDMSYLVRPLHLVEKGKPVDMPHLDMGFYTDFNEAFEKYDFWLNGLYNKARNYLIKKPFSADKFKLNFGKPTLLQGWDLNKEQANLGVLLRKDDNYFLAIMHPEHSKVFKNYPPPEGNEESYEKIQYKQISKMAGNFPRIFFSEKYRKNHDIPEEINRIYDNKEHTVQEDVVNLKSLHKLINFFKDNINKYEKYGFCWKNFDFCFSPTESYKNISEFYKEAERQAYKIGFSRIPTSYIDQCVREERIFLFHIYNKDFSRHSKGRPNLHTLYWRALFEEENLHDVVIKLDSEAEIFYRDRSLNKTAIHKANEPLQNKNNHGKTSCFAYDIVKDQRYTQDKFLFHVPVTLNFKAPENKNLNEKVNRAVRNNPDVHIIGIDRGERHLLYYSVIDQCGRIIKQGSLNDIQTDQGYKIDYRQKLDEKEKRRDEARKSWSAIENIKELKAGYLSQIVHQLARLIIEYNAIVCLEDLNTGFKRGQFKIEKQVYQKFEKALIDKLNYLVFKDARQGQTGHYLKAYQLTAPFTSFEKMGKQSGILYYVPAAYTSRVDPATGFISFLYTKYESLKKSKEFFENMGPSDIILIKSILSLKLIIQNFL